jgi:hypothetical protein
VSYPDAPHYDLAFRMVGSSFSAVEQDTLEDVSNNVEAALRYRQGERQDEPTFGTDELVFQEDPVNLEVLVGQILLHEPRAYMVTEQAIDRLEELITHVQLKLKQGGAPPP